MATPIQIDETREIVISRTFDAPREIVWEAWTDPRHLARWWGPDGFAARVRELDLRVGGTFLLHLRGPDGRDYPCKGIYREIVKPERIVWLGVPEDGHPCGAGLPPRAIVTVTFKPAGGRTELTIHTRLESTSDREAAITHGYFQGWTQSLARLAAHMPPAPGGMP
jgi:uncharacterized protein YndB with AHSA1/START domain